MQIPVGRSAKFCVFGGLLLVLGVSLSLCARVVLSRPPDLSENTPEPPQHATRGERTPRDQARVKPPQDTGETPGPDASSLPENDGFIIARGKFSPADTVIGVLMAHKVARSEIQEILGSVRQRRLFSRVRAGRRYEVRRSRADGEFREFILQLDRKKQLRISRTPSGEMAAEREEIPYSRDVVRVHSRIDTSLYKAVADAGGAPGLVGNLSDIFAYVIDFHKDIRSGDQVDVLVERNHLRGEFTGYGRVLAAEFTVGGRRHTAVYFDHDGGRYYNSEGESLRRTFLKSPLRYTRISSRFSRRRFHPLLKRYRPHLGVDYAAPRGTPVHAVADGVVAWAGRKRQAGKMVELRHGGGYRTAYLHLHRYARGVRAGRRVSQGQVIGYVGSTGLSTGPHLDYRISRRGRYLNPLTAKLPRGRPLPRALRPAFKRVLDARRTMLDNLPRLREWQAAPPAREPAAGAGDRRTSSLAPPTRPGRNCAC